MADSRTQEMADINDVNVTTAANRDAERSMSPQDDSTQQKNKYASLKQFCVTLLVFIVGCAAVLVIIYLSISLALGKNTKQIYPGQIQ